MVALDIAVVNTGRLHSHTTMGRLPFVALLISLVGSQAAAAPAKTKHAKQTLALAPAQADGMSKTALDGIDRALASHAGANAEVVGTKVLDKRVTPDFATAVRFCKRENRCLTKLAKTVRVDGILVPYAKPEKSGTGLTILVAGEKVQKVSFIFVTSADLNAAITANAATLFGDDAAPPTDIDSIAALPLEPLAVEPIPAPTPTPPPAEVKAEPPPAPTPPPAEVVLTPPPAALIEPAVPEAPPLDDSIVTRREEPIVTWKTYVGSAAVVLGAAATTYGILQYAHHKSLVDDANGNPNLTQREASDINDDAQSAYTRSQVAIFAGAPLLVIGAGLVVWDLFVDDHSIASHRRDNGLRWSLMPDGRGGASGAMILRF